MKFNDVIVKEKALHKSMSQNYNYLKYVWFGQILDRIEQKWMWSEGMCFPSLKHSLGDPKIVVEIQAIPKSVRLPELLHLSGSFPF